MTASHLPVAQRPGEEAVPSIMNGFASSLAGKAPPGISAASFTLRPPSLVLIFIETLRMVTHNCWKATAEVSCDTLAGQRRSDSASLLLLAGR